MAKIKAKTEKENTKIKKAKKNKINHVKNYDEESIEAKKVIIVLLVTVVLIIGLYFLSTVIVNKRESDNTTNTSTEVNIDYNLASVGTILNRPYDKYYTLIYDSEDSKAMFYSMLITNYQSKKDSLKIYFCDLGDELNKKYKSDSEKGNKNAKDTNEFSFGRVTLIKIEKGKIVSYIEDEESIKKALQ